MGKSSKDKRDAYYRLAKEQGWRARSAFKLLQLDQEFNLFQGVTRVVDLCAAPGSWSQVLSRVLIKREKFLPTLWADEAALAKSLELGLVLSQPTPAIPPQSPITTTTTNGAYRDVKIVAIDLQPMSPLDGVTTMVADITHPSTIPRLLDALDPPSSTAAATHHDGNNNKAAPRCQRPVDLVLSDGAPDVTGLHDLDVYIQSQLLCAALNLALCVLRPGGSFVAKIFRAKDIDLLYYQMRLLFASVTVAKPRSSRSSSFEAFIVCRHYCPPADFEPSLDQPFAQRFLSTGTTAGTSADTNADADADANAAPETGPPPASTKTELEPRAFMRNDGTTELDFQDPQSDSRWIAPFLACGDLFSWDSDATYVLPKDRIVLDPVQPPTAPPYKVALEMRKTHGDTYGRS